MIGIKVCDDGGKGLEAIVADGIVSRSTHASPADDRVLVGPLAGLCVVDARTGEADHKLDRQGKSRQGHV